MSERERALRLAEQKKCIVCGKQDDNPADRHKRGLCSSHYQMWIRSRNALKRRTLERNPSATKTEVKQALRRFEDILIEAGKILGSRQGTRQPSRELNPFAERLEEFLAAQMEDTATEIEKDRRRPKKKAP